MSIFFMLGLAALTSACVSEIAVWTLISEDQGKD